MLNTLARSLKRFLIGLLVYAAAVLLLLEDWLWDATSHALDRLGAFELFRRIGAYIATLPPYAALASFILPSLLLFPVKILALLALTKGHLAWGGAIIAGAKIGGTALTAKLYQLTKPSLMRLPWLARMLTTFIGFKDRLIDSLKATEAWQKLDRTRSRVRRRLKIMRRWWRIRFGKSRLRRLIGKLLARRR